ncbi:MAG: phosphodiester glycosidase family protein [Armatimonadota bacterium]|nr:phosphodiester glycosidase family protein [bacterium]MDW8320390.1 phosphodiester glycosidase family protein [Armatimonadota bacterium]
MQVKIGLAKGLVGRVEPLDGIAQRYGASIAINGSFFDAYTSNPIKNPHHTLITDGTIVHKGNVGCIIGFSRYNEVRIDRLQLSIWGTVGYREWYAYWINRFPESANTATIFTRYWGTETGLKDGVQIVVSGGVVRSKGSGSQFIPPDGFVLYLRGEPNSLAERFRVGYRASYDVVRSDGREDRFWSNVQEALGCGPTLLTNGSIAYDPVSEGFRHPKILTLSGARSAVGVTQDNQLLLVTCRSATVRQMASVMKALGAYHAMNLDGGASSGLWVRGRYLTRPGREISNALLVFDRG